MAGITEKLLEIVTFELSIHEHFMMKIMMIIMTLIMTIILTIIIIIVMIIVMIMIMTMILMIIIIMVSNLFQTLHCSYKWKQCLSNPLKTYFKKYGNQITTS